jgi:hypothetical protein
MRGITFFTLLSAFVATQGTPLAANLAVPPVIDYIVAHKGDNGAISFGENARDGLYMSHNSTHFSYHGITAANPDNVYVLVDRMRPCSTHKCGVQSGGASHY